MQKFAVSVCLALVACVGHARRVTFNPSAPAAIATHTNPVQNLARARPTLMMSNVWETLPGLTGPAIYQMDMMTRVNTLKGYDPFDKAIAAFQAAGLSDTLKTMSPMTFFLPVNSAFDEFSRKQGKAFSELPVDQQKSILSNHIVKGKIEFEELGGPPGATKTAETAAGKTIKYGIPEVGKRKMINDEVWVPGWANPSGLEDTAFVHDKECTNGVIHGVDKLMNF